MKAISNPEPINEQALKVVSNGVIAIINTSNSGEKHGRGNICDLSKVKSSIRSVSSWKSSQINKTKCN